MKIDTALNHRNRVKSQLSDLIATAMSCGMESKKITSKKIEIMATIKHCPQWVRSYCDGWFDAQYAIAQRKLVFCYTMPNGQLVSSHSDRADYYQKLGYSPRQVTEKAVFSGHYWVVDGEYRLHYGSSMDE